MEIEILRFITKNKSFNDDDIEEFSKHTNIPTSVIRNEIYKFVSTFLSGGRYNKMKNIDPKELKKEILDGMKIEYEHTLDTQSVYSKYISRRISLDHLSESKKYYDYLEEMEKKF